MTQQHASAARRTQLLLTVAFSLVFLALIGWLAAIQICSRDALTRRAERQHTVHKTIPPFRGYILDRHSRAMAATVDGCTVFADPKFIHQQGTPTGADRNTDRQPSGHTASRDGQAAMTCLADAQSIDDMYRSNRLHVAQQVAPLLAMNAEEVETLVAADPHKQFVRLKRGVDGPTREAVQSLGLRGIGFQSEGLRCYPNGTLAAHLVCGVGVDNQPHGGLEYQYNNQLRGSSGSRVLEVDGRRRAVWIRNDNYTPARDGQLVVTTIDLAIQAFTEKALATAVTRFKARGGSALVMDPATGEILALANYPTFDPTEYAEADPYVSRNRLLTDPYEPGSTFKCFVSTAALQAGVVKPNEKIFCHNGFAVIDGRRMTDHHPFGSLTFQEVVIRSSNIGMAVLGKRLGNEQLYEAVCRFGFGEKTGVSLPGESSGLVYPLDRWHKWSATSIPMGYEILVTPLQIATAFSSIANGGQLLRPSVTRYVCAADQTIVEDHREPVVVRRVMSEETARFMRHKVLHEVVWSDIGTGKQARIPGYGVFGKTGTAKKKNPHGGGYSSELYVGSFIAAAPLDNPRVVVMVVIDEPQKSIAYYGGTVAAPAVREILAKCLGYLDVPPDEPARLAAATHRSH
ncbi:MAG: penicillin-binding protein 2 [Planctomycetes bacterium]|nr:penicillin-binding protein 2 [Planctomycetota bacterium]